MGWNRYPFQYKKKIEAKIPSIDQNLLCVSVASVSIGRLFSQIRLWSSEDFQLNKSTILHLLATNAILKTIADKFMKNKNRPFILQKSSRYDIRIRYIFETH